MFKKLNLFSAASMKVLHTLASDPMRSFYQREVAKEADVSVGSANRVLEILTGEGLVESQDRGKIRLYRFNVDNPVARQIKVLFNIIELERLVDELKPHSRRIVLFGSCAEGRDIKESDIDLFVLATEKEIISRIIGRHASEKGLAPIVVDSNELMALRNDNKPLYDEINRGITLWERD